MFFIVLLLGRGCKKDSLKVMSLSSFQLREAILSMEILIMGLQKNGLLSEHVQLSTIGKFLLSIFHYKISKKILTTKS
jgi:hypothetical protein